METYNSTKKEQACKRNHTCEFIFLTSSLSCSFTDDRGELAVIWRLMQPGSYISVLSSF